MGLLSSTSLWKIDCQCALTDAAAAAYDNKGRCRKKNFTTIRLLTKVWPAALRCYALLLQRTFPKRDIKGGDFLRVNCILFWRCSLFYNSSLGSGSTFPASETNCLQFSWKKINISNIHPSNANDSNKKVTQMIFSKILNFVNFHHFIHLFYFFQETYVKMLVKNVVER